MDKRFDDARRLFIRVAASGIGGVALAACGGGTEDEPLESASGSAMPSAPSSPPSTPPATSPSPRPAPPPPNAPPAPVPADPPQAGTSALAMAAAALSPGQWGTWTVANSFNPDPVGTGDTIFSYAQRATWDAGRKVIQFWGGA